MLLIFKYICTIIHSKTKLRYLTCHVLKINKIKKKKKGLGNNVTFQKGILIR